MERLFLQVVFVLKLTTVVIGANSYSRDDFPSDFVFGAGTTAYQVEGAAFEDGRTPSIWDTSIHSGSGQHGNGDVACDEYHKYKEDVQIMADIGLEAYRFSISWPRLLPNGRGPVNPKALQYYNNLIDELVSHGIEPHATLYHNDLPQALEDEYGGWVNRKIIKDFTDYADVCFREFGDRVRHWTTLGEPNVFVPGGYDFGFVAPMRCSPPFGLTKCSRGNSSTEPYIAAHHMLISHASVTRLYWRKYQGKQLGFIGISLYTYWSAPLTDSREDIMANQRSIDFLISWFMDPLVFGDYPSSMKKLAGSRIPTFTKSESILVKGAFDFVGIIHYSTAKVKDNPSNLSIETRDYGADMGALIFTAVDPTNASIVNEVSHAIFKCVWVEYLHYMTTRVCATQLPVEPWGMRGILGYFQQVYGNPPIYVHENGQTMLRNLTLEDTPRVEYISAYIGAVLDALRNGSNTKGYFVWSFLDVFELLNGYESGYGLVYVDLDDPELKRTPKLSAKWYSKFLKGDFIVTPVSDNELGNNRSATS